MTLFSNIVDRNSKTQKIEGINYKEASKLVALVLAIFAIVTILLSQIMMPEHSLFYSVLIGLSIALGLVLYVGGLIVSIIAFKKAHDLFRRDDGWRESVAA